MVNVPLLEVFPAALLDADKLDDVIFFLQRLPIAPRRKKQALLAWGRFVGVAITREMYDQLLGPDRDRV